jgi:hypothetical protein
VCGGQRWRKRKSQGHTEIGDFCSAGGHVKCLSHCGKVPWFIEKLNIELPYYTAVSILSIYPKVLKAVSVTCTLYK